MKVKTECAHCGKSEKLKHHIDIKDADRDRFMEFVEVAGKAGIEGTVPPSRFPKFHIVIPSPGQNPCGLCKHGQESVGPIGCGRGKSCLAWQYFQLHKLTSTTKSDSMSALKEFVCAAPNASWLAPTRKRTSAKSVDLPFVTKQPNSSPPAASAKKSARRKSKWRSS